MDLLIKDDQSTPLETESEQTLTHKKEMFALAYLKSGNATQAAIDAGYTSVREHAQSIGSNLLKELSVKSYIDEQKSIIALRCKIDFEWNLLKLRDVVETHSIKYQSASGEKMIDAKSVLSALDMISKQMGYYAPEQYDHTVNNFKIDEETLKNFKRDF